MAEAVTLQSIQSILNFGQCASQIIVPRAGLEMLVAGPWVYHDGANTTDPERMVLMTMTFLNDLLGPAEKDSPVDSLQFYLEFPFEIPPAKVSSILRLVSLYNNVVPLGAFGLTMTGQLCFRYQWRVYNRDIDGLLLLEIMQNLLFFTERLGYKFEELAKGKKTLDQISQEPIDFSGKPSSN